MLNLFQGLKYETLKRVQGDALLWCSGWRYPTPSCWTWFSISKFRYPTPSCWTWFSISKRDPETSSGWRYHYLVML